MYLVVSLNKMAPILQNGVPLVDGAGAQYFTWTYDSENNTIIGIQNQAIPGKPDPFTTVGGVINFYGTVTGEATPDQARAFNGVGFNANINPGFGGNISNQNDAASTYTYTTGSLPVTLMAFSGRYQEGVGNVLSWATASEKNNALFQVERSVDAQRFESIGTVKGKGTTAARSQYTFTDANASAAVTYYRLKQVDIDGQFTYTRTIALRRGEGTVALKTYPNPVVTELSYEVDAKVDALRIRNMAGMNVLDRKVGSEMTNRVDVSRLSAGTYVFEVQTSEGSLLRQRFIKQ